MLCVFLMISSPHHGELVGPCRRLQHYKRAESESLSFLEGKLSNKARLLELAHFFFFFCKWPTLYFRLCGTQSLSLLLLLFLILKYLQEHTKSIHIKTGFGTGRVVVMIFNSLY